MKQSPVSSHPPSLNYCNLYWYLAPPIEIEHLSNSSCRSHWEKEKQKANDDDIRQLSRKKLPGTKLIVNLLSGQIDNDEEETRLLRARDHWFVHHCPSIPKGNSQLSREGTTV